MTYYLEGRVRTRYQSIRLISPYEDYLYVETHAIQYLM